MQKEFTVLIQDGEIYINGTLHEFFHKMDLKSDENDVNKKALLALANEMGYEAQFLFEEMAGRLAEMANDNNEAFPIIDNEMIKIWVEQLLKETGTANISELSVEDIKKEIKEIEGTIKNHELWGQSTATHKEYLEILNQILARKEEKENV